MKKAYGVYPDSVRYDLNNKNTLMAVFRLREQAEIFGRMMWSVFYVIKEIDSPHFVKEKKWKS